MEYRTFSGHGPLADKITWTISRQLVDIGLLADTTFFLVILSSFLAFFLIYLSIEYLFEFVNLDEFMND